MKKWMRAAAIAAAYTLLAGHTSCEDIKPRPGQTVKPDESEAIQGNAAQAEIAETVEGKDQQNFMA
ncbi:MULTISPECIES: hypothetical protein [unclassified Paenibacillus]|uniref:Secreted protein n=1 Tax=Paenibacillus provencensis TaxID=441151 RepID=A0ABW3PQQ6_9BACL|nr:MULTISPECIES: hypothetical protein [unclassified Paenibacillus]MCM3128162.1 hypothetical protein [Paenibacillus sp. MER 78]SFS83038.1 hypothetical protein SAMN04488601_104172 [Paenibacillus sp. 453mf]